MEKNVDDLREKWLAILEKIVSAYQTGDLKRFFPRDPIHEKCGHSHEGMEFLDAISLQLLWEILNGKKFDDLAKKYKFMR